MHKKSVTIHTHLCWKFKVRVPKNNSDNRQITAAVKLKFIVHVINFPGFCTGCPVGRLFRVFIEEAYI